MYGSAKIAFFVDIRPINIILTRKVRKKTLGQRIGVKFRFIIVSFFLKKYNYM